MFDHPTRRSPAPPVPSSLPTQANTEELPCTWLAIISGSQQQPSFGDKAPPWPPQRRPPLPQSLFQPSANLNRRQSKL